MIALTHPTAFLARLRDPRTLRRASIAGAAWGAALTVGLTALSAWQCGGVCIDEAVWFAGVSVTTGILAIGPIAAFGRPTGE